ncbi:MAG: hypothetical protein LBF77_05070 [Spirochaetaceae bacterium]|nr:hypothetical protein [Spirochaetaceae bacterium]
MFPLPVSSQSSGLIQGEWSLLAGSGQGLCGINPLGGQEILWSGGEVKKIIPRNFAGTTDWVILTDRGILLSRDLKNWEYRNQGLPVRTIKIFEDGVKSFQSVVREIKDLEVNPQNPEIMVCAVKNGVFLSRNGGGTWTSLGMPHFRTDGIKAAAVVYTGIDELTVFCSHNIYGLFYYQPDKADARWTELNGGLEKLESTANPDEVSDIGAIFPDPALGAGNRQTGVFVSQTFRRRIYRLSWDEKRFELIWSGAPGPGTVDSLSPGGDSLAFVQDGAVGELRFPSFPDRGAVAAAGSAPLFVPKADLLAAIRTIPANQDAKANCAVLRGTGRAGSPPVSLSELWLLNEEEDFPAGVSGREGLYLPVNHAMDSASLKPYLDIMEDRKLDMVVIDMKDDYGRLRFTPKDREITNWGRVFRPVDIDAFLKEMKSRKIYTVARIVVFKDPEATRKEGGKYAVWDTAHSKPWKGYYDTRRKKSPGSQAEESNSALTSEILPADDPAYEIVRTYYDEVWVDPYSEEVWAYNAAVAVELCERGFDEIQFDYIRFPTDGVYLADARYRFQDPGMDMDSAIISFLRHVRSRLTAPVSVDIYGANGWYRTGARTGQEVELLSPWVDVICPMYYPSHFEQDFLAQDPPELRPYRIYFQGTQRTRRIARGKIIVRPWIQAFYLNVAYDRKYYDLDYVRREVEGVRDSGRGGLTYWNNLGRYEDIPGR